MKLEYTTGCVCDALDIEGNPTYQMKAETLQKYIREAIKQVSDTGTLQDILISIATSAGTYKLIGKCDQCGDIIEEYTLEF